MVHYKLMVALDTVFGDDVSLLSDDAVLNFGADSEIKLTHIADTGLRLTDSGGTPTLQLHDQNESIASDGSKVIITSGGTAFSLPTSDGSNGQALVTNGGAVLSFADVASNTPSSADGQALGSASAEWSDLFLADGGQILFGNDQEITLTHVADDGLVLKHVGTADGKEPSFSFHAGDNDIAANDVLGSIFFKAPDEGAGTDAILVAAGIEAVSEGDFSASSNATKLSFLTGASEAAAEKMSLSSAGVLTVDGGVAIDNITIDGTEIDLSSGDLTVDVAGDIILDAGGNDFKFSAGGTEVLNITNSSSDVIIKPVVDAKDIIFQQRDGTEVARVEDNGTFNIVTDKLAINGTAVTATAAELNFIDGGATVGTTAVADGDGIIHNDDGTMKVTSAATFKTYFQSGLSSGLSAQETLVFSLAA